MEHAAKLILGFSPSSNSLVVFGFDKRTPILASQSVSGALRYFPSLLGAPAATAPAPPRAYYHLLNYYRCSKKPTRIPKPLFPCLCLGKRGRQSLVINHSLISYLVPPTAEHQPARDGFVSTLKFLHVFFFSFSFFSSLLGVRKLLGNFVT